MSEEEKSVTIESVKVTLSYHDGITPEQWKRRAEAAEALLREVVGLFRLAEDGHVDMLTLDDWGHLNPEAAEVVKRVRAHLKLEGGS